jgi:hypothetical protein
MVTASTLQVRRPTRLLVNVTQGKGKQDITVMKSSASGATKRPQSQVTGSESRLCNFSSWPRQNPSERPAVVSRRDSNIDTPWRRKRIKIILVGHDRKLHAPFFLVAPPANRQGAGAGIGVVTATGSLTAKHRSAWELSFDSDSDSR